MFSSHLGTRGPYLLGFTVSGDLLRPCSLVSPETQAPGLWPSCLPGLPPRPGFRAPPHPSGCREGRRRVGSGEEGHRPDWSSVTRLLARCPEMPSRRPPCCRCTSPSGRPPTSSCPVLSRGLLAITARPTGAREESGKAVRSPPAASPGPPGLAFGDGAPEVPRPSRDDPTGAGWVHPTGVAFPWLAFCCTCCGALHPGHRTKTLEFTKPP